MQKKNQNAKEKSNLRWLQMELDLCLCVCVCWGGCLGYNLTRFQFLILTRIGCKDNTVNKWLDNVLLGGFLLCSFQVTGVMEPERSSPSPTR